MVPGQSDTQTDKMILDPISQFTPTKQTHKKPQNKEIPGWTIGLSVKSKDIFMASR